MTYSILYTTEWGGNVKVVRNATWDQFDEILDTGRLVYRGDSREGEAPAVDVEVKHVEIVYAIGHHDFPERT